MPASPAMPRQQLGVNPLQDLLDEEKRKQQNDGSSQRHSQSLMSDIDFEKLKADVVNDHSGK